MSRRGLRAARRTASIASAILAMFLSGCATNPVTGKRQISFVSPSKEIEMGRESDPAVLAQYGLYGDSTVQQYVDSIGQRLAANSQLPGLTWHFRVLDSPEVNAFAIPGGYIYITRGILAYLNSEAQLAGVLGHEIGHVNARHTAQQITRSDIASIGLLASAIFVDAFRPYSVLAQQGLGLLFLRYSRENETQADELGIEYATRAGYDPREIPATYQMLKRVEQRTGASLPSFLETHPDPGDREIRTAQIAKASAGSTRRDLIINSGSYRRHIEGLIWGNDPRGGFFEGNRFYHPDLAFQIIFPDGWERQNLPSAVVAQNQALGGAMELTLQTAEDTTLTPALYVESLRRGGRIQDAVGRSESFRDYAAWIGTIIAGGGGGRTAFVAGFVRYRPGQFLQVLGQSKSDTDQAAEQIRASIRSIAALRDSSKLSVMPNRVHVATVLSGGTLSEVVGTLGPQALDLEQTATLNNLRATTAVPAGSPLKIIRKGTRA
jgi:predicted Zn-dependent protease